MNDLVKTPYEITDGQTIRRAFSGPVIKSIDESKRLIDFIISTAAVDRYGDVITVSGWDLKAYKQNPVVLFGHLSSIPPIGRAVKVWKDGDALRATAEFMPREISAFADSIFQMYVKGFLKATSVGFLPTKYEKIIDPESGDWTYGYKFLKQELLEFSAVPVPANAEALIQARSKGIDTLPFKTWAEEILDNWDRVQKDVDALYGAGRKEIENIRRRAAGAGATIRVPIDVQDDLLAKNLKAIREAKEKKGNAMTFETVEILGQEVDIPVRTLKEGEKTGTIEIVKNVDEDKAETIEITKAEDFIRITPEVLGDVNQKTLTLDAESSGGWLLTAKAANGEVVYTIDGVDPETGDIFATKAKDALTQPESEESDETADETVDSEKDTDTEETANAGGETETKNVVNVIDSAALAEFLKTDKGQEILTNVLKDKVVLGKEEEMDDQPLDFAGEMRFLETTLCQFEESLKVDKSLTVHDKRKKHFLAGYMRELADRLDGGVKNSGAGSTATIVPTKDETKFNNVDEVKAYAKDLTAKLEPMLAELVGQKLAKMRGRLD